MDCQELVGSEVREKLGARESASFGINIRKGRGKRRTIPP